MRHVRIVSGGPSLERPERVARLLTPVFRGLGWEELWVLHLDPGLGLLHVSVVKGHGSVAMPIGRIAREALALGARAVLIAHNHPAGTPEPSRADRIATARLARALRPIGLSLLDHLVFGGGDWISFRRRGWL